MRSVFPKTRTSLHGRSLRRWRRLTGNFCRPIVPGLVFWAATGLPGHAQDSQKFDLQRSAGGDRTLALSTLPDAPGMDALAQALPPGSVGGLVVDVNGKVVPGARVTLERSGAAARQQVTTGPDGQFFFAGVPAGTLRITIDAPTFAGQTIQVVLHAGEALQAPDTVLTVGATTTEVQVTMTQEELAEKQIKVEEKQHVLGVIPNFYASYDHNAVPLTSKQKYELAWKSSIDPATFVITGIGAGIEQATNAFSGYGQGAQGYAKRYGAGYADDVIGTMIGGAILPSLFKQDPRYFWKGDGTIRSRVVYAIGRAVLTKGDNGKTQPDYSGLLGSLAAAGISNLYYPASDRNGAGLTFENFAIGIGGSAIGNLFQEFLVKKLTPHTHDAKPADPQLVQRAGSPDTVLY